MNDSLYPPSVQGAPPELTVPNAAYRRQVVIVLASLAAFILFYLSLVIGSGWAVVAAVNQAVNAPPPENGGHSDTNGYLGLAILAGILFLFLVKAFFKWRKQERELRMEITRQEHPALFHFIQKICEDTRAPFPKRVFLTPEVNAAVFYDSSLLSLVLPVKKNLLIGLGLVNGLNLSEFKAVLAHEFGHFSQSSMRLGSYVYVANRVIYDLVYHRDAFDDLLAQARRTNIRIAIFAYLITGVLWVLRKILQGVFKMINFFESALSRQMEFHADLVAVSVTGSDSLIHALKKLDFINACLMQSISDLKAAAEHKLYTQDLFYHQTKAAEHLRRTLNKPDIDRIPALPEDPKQKTQLFDKNEEGEDADGMWASHPSHYDREQNAKRRYIRSIEDARSPWLLFNHPEQLRRRMTERVYQHVLELQGADLTPPEQVQAFIDGEHEETAQDPRYEGLYDGRPLSIPSEKLVDYANDPDIPVMTSERIETLLNKLYNAEYKEWMEQHGKRQEEIRMLRALERGDAKIKGSVFEFRGGRYGKSNIPSLVERVEKELEADAEWLTAFDREVFQVHLRMAQIVGEGDDDLFNRYYFHLHLQDVLKTAHLEEFRLGSLFQYLSTKESSLSTKEFEQVQAALQEAQRNINAAYEKTRSLEIPALQNMQAGQTLNAYLLQEVLIHPLPTTEAKIDGEWAGKLMRQVSQIEERSRRLYFKSMGAILTRQEAVAQNYRSKVLEAPLES